jgi:hypothetical protein
VHFFLFYAGVSIEASLEEIKLVFSGEKHLKLDGENR